MKNLVNGKHESLMDRLKELGRKHGVKVADLSERGIQAIGIIGGVQKANPAQNPNPIPSTGELSGVQL